MGPGDKGYPLISKTIFPEAKSIIAREEQLMDDDMEMYGRSFLFNNLLRGVRTYAVRSNLVTTGAGGIHKRKGKRSENMRSS